MQAAGLKVTAQGLHKWMHGGGISADNLKDLARYFGVSPAFLYFGETTEASNLVDDLTPDARLIAKAWLRMPERFRTPLAVEILKVAQAFADKRDVQFQFSMKQALEKLTKGES
jgi:transcriptional regulator with XRE-family HTH domain